MIPKPDPRELYDLVYRDDTLPIACIVAFCIGMAVALAILIAFTGGTL